MTNSAKAQLAPGMELVPSAWWAEQTGGGHGTGGQPGRGRFGRAGTSCRPRLPGSLSRASFPSAARSARTRAGRNGRSRWAPQPGARDLLPGGGTAAPRAPVRSAVPRVPVRRARGRSARLCSAGGAGPSPPPRYTTGRRKRRVSQVPPQLAGSPHPPCAHPTPPALRRALPAFVPCLLRAAGARGGR